MVRDAIAVPDGPQTVVIEVRDSGASFYLNLLSKAIFTPSPKRSETVVGDEKQNAPAVFIGG